MLVNKKTEKMFLIGKLQADWKKIVGEHIGESTSPIKIEENKLFLKCKNTTWKTELLYQTRQLIKKINKSQSIKIREIILL